MRCAVWKLLVLAISLCATAGLAQDDAPSTRSFLRRKSARATVLGDYVYFDGGEISQRGFNGSRPSNPVNSTLAIDLSTSWHPSNATMTSTPKPTSAPRHLKQGLFADVSSDSFYIWGGEASYSSPPAISRLWRFGADGSGSGNWTTETPADPDTFASLHRAEGGAFASTPDAGYWVGGSATNLTTPESDPPGHVSGVLSLNYSTTAWRNDSSAPVTPDGTLYGASATYAPPQEEGRFGPNGLVVLLGGTTRPVDEASSHIDFDQVSFFDPVTREWHKQEATGNAPRARYDHCAVGAESPDGTFEIFVFGGRNDIHEESYDDVHVLSLPGFHWIKVNYEPRSPRAEHACVVAGNRQLLSIGGVDTGLGELGAWQDRDPFPQGLGVFDMTNLGWKREFDADAAEYQIPRVLRAWYQQGGLENVTWSSDTVASLFSQEANDSDSDPNLNSDNRDNDNDNDSDNEDDEPDNENDNGSDSSQETASDSGSPLMSSAGTIAGIAVGSVLGLALILAVIFILIRNQRRKERQEYARREEKLPRIEIVNTSASESDALPSQWPLGPPRPAPSPPRGGGGGGSSASSSARVSRAPRLSLGPTSATSWSTVLAPPPAAPGPPQRPPRPSSAQSPGPPASIRPASTGLAFWAADDLSHSFGPGPSVQELREARMEAGTARSMGARELDGRSCEAELEGSTPRGWNTA